MNLSVLTTTGAAAGGNMSSMLIMLLVYGAIIAAMYFIFFRPQNKKKKKEAEMRKNAQVGDEITTIGGICGRIIAVKDETDSVTWYGCGGDRRRFRFCFRFPCGAPRGGKRLAARPCAWHALCSFLCCDKRYAVCKYAGCTSCYTERNIRNMQRMRWSNGCE